MLGPATIDIAGNVFDLVGAEGVVTIESVEGAFAGERILAGCGAGEACAFGIGDDHGQARFVVIEDALGGRCVDGKGGGHADKRQRKSGGKGARQHVPKISQAG